MKMQSVMNHDFSKIPHANIRRSTFNRSHGHKTTLKVAGDLVPIYCDEVLPGDSFNLNMSAFARLATPIFPFMDNVFVETQFFFVPSRLLWNNFQKFHGEQKDPGDSIDFLMPKVTTPVGGHLNDSLYDHFGIPTEVDIENINNQWGRAYNLIWDEWFRDENLQDSLGNNFNSAGPDDPLNYTIQKRGKRHDYITSCLPFPQKGDAVSLPLGTSADIHSNAPAGTNVTVFSDAQTKRAELDALNNQVEMSVNNGADADKLYADLSTATASTVNQLREAFQIQALLETDARGGTRYTEIIKAHFGVTSPDARLQRPEYLGGGSTPLNINQVAQTSASDTQPTPQGNLSGFATANFSGHGFNKSFTEHGVIIGLISIRADLTYQNALDRMFTKESRFDYFYPELANIGEQAVLSKEIFADGSANDQDIFGYQERYAEYRHKMSIISGEFRSNFAQSLDTWHLAQKFTTRPVLDEAFIVEQPPITRVIAVQTSPHFLLDTYFKLTCARPMPTFAVPGIGTKF